MSPLGTLLVMFAAVHGVTGLSYWVVRREGQAGPEHRPMALLIFCAGVACIGSVLVAEHHDNALSTLGLLVRMFALRLAVPLFVEFQQALLQKPQPSILRAAWITVLLGMTVDTTLIMLAIPLDRSPPVWAMPWASPYGQPTLPLHVTASMSVWGLAMLAFVVHSLARVTRQARHDTHVRAILVTFGFAALAGAFDLLSRMTGGQVLHVLDIGLFFAAMAASRTMLMRFVSTTTELSERERQLAQTRSEVLRTESALLQSQRLAAVGELSAVVAHEVRNPLAIIKNAVSGLRRTPADSPAARELLDILVEESKRLKRLVSDLHSYAQPLAPQMGLLDVMKVVVAAVDRAGAQQSPDHPTQVIVEGAAHLHQVSGDADLLRLAFANVIENALQATRNHGRVTVEVAQQDQDFVDVTIRDCGPGMHEHVRAKALDPFFTTRPTGTGLGLAIVDRVVRAHGGMLRIDSIPGEGTRVSIRLRAK